VDRSFVQKVATGAVGSIAADHLAQVNGRLGQIADLDRVPAECSFNGREATFERV
jgi:hypothetical protein